MKKAQLEKEAERLRKFSELAKKLPRDEHGRFVTKAKGQEEVTPSSIEFKVGDRVETTARVGKGGIGTKGTVIDRDSTSCHYLVEFDIDIGGHNGRLPKEAGIRGKDGHCWWCPTDRLKPVVEKTDELIKQCYFCGSFRRASGGKMQEVDDKEYSYVNREHWVCLECINKVNSFDGLRLPVIRECPHCKGSLS